MEELLNSIANVGFPTVVSVYLLVRFESKINALTTSINSLENTLEKLSILSSKA